jgi:hypothetical protein
MGIVNLFFHRQGMDIMSGWLSDEGGDRMKVREEVLTIWWIPLT